jgi:hypothetical protein
VKGARRRMMPVSQRKMLADVPTADVVVTNPTHIAIALRYDPATMKAPRLVAKGIRLNAARIREIATSARIPILENKPLARLLFKHGRWVARFLLSCTWRSPKCSHGSTGPILTATLRQGFGPEPRIRTKRTGRFCRPTRQNLPIDQET